MMRKHTKRRYTAIVALLIFSACVMMFSGYKLWVARQVYAIGDRLYDDMAGGIRKTDTGFRNGQSIGRVLPGESQVETPEAIIDFAALQAVNKDAVAWLFGPNTEIDYPVMQAADYDWYLHHLPDGTENANGSLFLDYNSSSDFSGRLNIIYGHNMKSGKMFGTLTRYKEQAYYEATPELYLFTADSGNYRIDLIYGCVVDAGEWRSRAFMYEINLQSLLRYAAHNTTFESDVEYTDDDRFVVFSTCSYEFGDARYVVIGVLRPE